MAYVIGRVDRIIRHGVTRWGNPMHSVVINEEAYRLSNDAAINYGINNAEWKENEHKFLLTRAGRIWGYDKNWNAHGDGNS